MITILGYDLPEDDLDNLDDDIFDHKESYYREIVDLDYQYHAYHMRDAALPDINATMARYHVEPQPNRAQTVFMAFGVWDGLLDQYFERAGDMHGDDIMNQFHLDLAYQGNHSGRWNVVDVDGLEEELTAIYDKYEATT